MRPRVALALALVALVACLGNPSAAAPPTIRTVYVTVVDDSGKAVLGLTPADFVVKESGREQEIVSVASASERVHIALMVAQPLAGLTYVRTALAEFVIRMCPSAEIALFMVAQRAERLVDYSSSANALIDGIRNLPFGGSVSGAMVAEGIFEVSKQLEKARSERPAIVLVTTEQALATDYPEGVLSQLAKSKAQFWAVSVGSSAGGVVGRSAAGQTIGDGPQQSGGRLLPIIALAAFEEGLQRVADDLSSQYLITYALPAGVKTSDRISVSLKEPGWTLRAPSRVPK